MADAALVDWLAEHAHEVLGTEVALGAALAGAPFWRVATVDEGGRLGGVAVWVPGGVWYLEALTESAVRLLADVVAQAGGARPVTVRTSGTVKAWLRPWRRDLIVREHDQRVMVCRVAPGPGEGRWATPADRPALEQYVASYNRERGTALTVDWDRALARQAMAVLEHGDRIVAAARRTGATARYATIANVWTAPAHRRHGLASRLTAFLLTAVLADRPAVHLVVDEDNTAAVDLYRSLGFEDAGRAYTAHLATEGEGQWPVWSS